MRKSVIVILSIVVVLSFGGFFYLNHNQQAEIGYKEGLKMGYLCGFNDGRDRKPFNPDGIKTFVPLGDASTYNKAFLVGATEGYRKGYTSGKQTTS